MSENEVRDLEKELKDEELHARYTQFKNFCTTILSWDNPSLPSKKGVYYYTDHGPNHSRNVITLLNQLTVTIKDLKNFDLSDMEKFLVLCAAWSHDLGMQFGKMGENWEIIREKHHERSAEFLSILSKKHSGKNTEFLNIISNLDNAKQIYDVITPFNLDELHVLKNICEGHCSSLVLNDQKQEKPMVSGEDVRQHFLIALIRIADACDVSKNRAPEIIYDLYKDSMPDDSRSHWEKHQCINGVMANHDKLAIVLNCSIGNTEDAYLVYSIVKSIEKELLNIRKIFGKQRINIFGVAVNVYVYGSRFQDELDNLELLVEPPDAEKIKKSLILKLEKPFKNIQTDQGWNSSGEDARNSPDWYKKLTLYPYHLPFTYYKIFKCSSYPDGTHFELMYQPLLNHIRIELHLENYSAKQNIFEKFLNKKNEIEAKIGEKIEFRKKYGKYRGIGKRIELSKPIFVNENEIIEKISECLAKYIGALDPLIFEILENTIKESINEMYGIDVPIKIERKEKSNTTVNKNYIKNTVEL
jgi:hypothetical protein